MLIEGLGKATVANGLMRIEVLYRGADGEDIRGEDLLIPVNRVTTIIGGLQELFKRIEEAAEQKQQAQSPAVN